MLMAACTFTQLHHAQGPAGTSHLGPATLSPVWSVHAGPASERDWGKDREAVSSNESYPLCQSPR